MGRYGARHCALRFRWSAAMLWILMLHYGDEGDIGREYRKENTASSRGENYSSTSHQTVTFNQVLFIVSVEIVLAQCRVDAWGLEEWYSNPAWRASRGKAGSDIMHHLWFSIRSTQPYRLALRTFPSHDDERTAKNANNWSKHAFK